MRTSGSSFLALYPGRQVAGVGSISQTEYPPPDKGPVATQRNIKENSTKLKLRTTKKNLAIKRSTNSNIKESKNEESKKKQLPYAVCKKMNKVTLASGTHV
jgi:hypothetical protein